MSNIGKQALRVAKNYTKGYTEAQTKVRSATSNDPWGPTGAQMNEIAQMTFNQQDFVEIMEMMDKRLNDKGKNWRHVFKTLTLLDYCLHAGSENVVQYFKQNAYIIKTLKEFQYVDEYGKDQGANVRQKAKDISNLLLDDARLREARRSRARMTNNLSGGANPPWDQEEPRTYEPPREPPSDRNRNRNRGGGDDDKELQRAIEASKRSAAEEAAKQKAENDLEEAIRLSKEEEEKRKRALEGGGSLFDENAPDPGTSGGSLIDFTTPIQAQPTGYPLQFASYNPYAQFQQQQDDYMRMQAAAEQQRQMEEAAAQAAYQQQMLQAQAAQAEAQRQAEAQAYQQQMLFQQQQAQQQQAYLQAQATAAPLMPQHTAYGSNNPFAPFSQAASPPPPMPSIPDQSPSLFSSIPASSPAPAPAPAPVPAHSPSPAFNQPKKKDDGEFAKLAALLGNREDGVDSFGNVGNLRVPVGTAFHASNRMAAQNTGNPNGNFNSAFGQPQQQSQDPNPFFTI